MLKSRYLTCVFSVLCVGEVSFATILPPNNLHLQDTILGSNMTEDEFNEILDQAAQVYAPIISQTHGARLSINSHWEDSTVNASASQFFGTWHVDMYGGLARRPEVTKDGFALVVCHELGHHLAGYPFSGSWAANEGQSDYFATLSCARNLWAGELEVNASFRETIAQMPKQLCDDTWAEEAEQNLCYRAMEAGHSLANLLGAMKGSDIAYENTDESVVDSTSHSHPAAQCRLDTYMAGALCGATFNSEFIPGKGLGRKRNSAEAEAEAAEHSCVRSAGHVVGMRPLCWFSPQEQ
jgi:hypothetical protein